MAQPQPTDFLALPIVGTDLIAFFRKGDISRPLYVRYSTLLNAIIAAAGTGSSFQLIVQDEGVVISSAAQFLNFVGDGVTVTANGTGVDITIDGAPDITADNGLTKDTATNIQLGGELLKDTQITSEEFQLSVLGDSTFPKRVFYVQNSGTGTAIEGVGLSSGAGVAGINNSGTGVIGSSTNGFAVRAVSSGGSGIAFDAVKTASSTNTIEVVATIKRETSGTGANNIGGSIDYYSEADSIASIPMAMRHIWRWVNASFASRVSQFELNLVANAIEQRVLAINGNGQATLDKYGVGTFKSKPTYGIGSDASGNLVEYNALPVVVSTSITAELNTDYIMVASSTFTDPTPAEGEGYSVFVRNGTATIGGSIYANAGTTIRRIYHSGAWANYVVFNEPVHVLKSTTNGTTTSGATNTVSSTQLVKGSTALAGNIIRVTSRGIFTGLGGAKTMRIYLNSTPNLSGSPILLATSQTATSALFAQMKRDLTIKSATETEFMSATLATLFTDESQTASVRTTANIDWTQDWYLVFANQCSVGTDTALTSMYTIEFL